MTSLIDLKDVSVVYTHASRPALREVSLELREGSCLGIVGESGSGKSTLGNILLGLVPRHAIQQGQFSWKGRNIGLASSEHRKLRGADIGIVPQNASASLNPSISIIRHFEGVLVDNLHIRRSDIRSTAEGWLDRVGLVKDTLDAFPYQLSGGQRQRALIALALAAQPQVVVLDECTTALDVTTQSEILQLVRRLRNQISTAFIMISHDLDVVASVSDDILVLYSGQVVEQNRTRTIARGGYHPYTKGLWGSRPTTQPRAKRLAVIPGHLPELDLAARQCIFEPRCPFREVECLTEQPFQEHRGALVRCIRTPVVGDLSWPQAGEERGEQHGVDDYRLLTVSDLAKNFTRRRGRNVTALAGVELTLLEGETLGIVGESGSGKTTLARCLVGTVKPSSGSVLLDGRLVLDHSGKHQFPHKRVQMVFQDPLGALNPRHRVVEQVGRPLRLHEGMGKREASKRAREMLEMVGLPSQFDHRFPHQLSGGEAQRVNIARALVSRPDIVILDEPVTALDASVQGAILNLLHDLQAEFELSYILIGHDLSVVRHMADRIIVMKRGRIVEEAETVALFDSPRHPYTQTLLEASRIQNPWSTTDRLGGGRPTAETPPLSSGEQPA